MILSKSPLGHLSVNAGLSSYSMDSASILQAIFASQTPIESMVPGNVLNAMVEKHRPGHWILSDSFLLFLTCTTNGINGSFWYPVVENLHHGPATPLLNGIFPLEYPFRREGILNHVDLMRRLHPSLQSFTNAKDFWIALPD